MNAKAESINSEETLTLFLLGVVVLLIDMHSIIYSVRQQLKRVHDLDVSTLLLPDESSNHCGEQDLRCVRLQKNVSAQTPFSLFVAVTRTLHWSPLL